MLSITSECVGRGFDKYRVAANSLPDLPIAPRSGHHGVTRHFAHPTAYPRFGDALPVDNLPYACFGFSPGRPRNAGLH